MSEVESHYTAEPPSLRVGPLLRYVDDTRATIWVETDRPCDVVVEFAGSGHHASTWTIHGHHYAIVSLEGLTPCTTEPYTVSLDGTVVWPLAEFDFPPSVIRTPDPERPFRLAFGSCRRSAPETKEIFDEIGADALVAMARRMAGEPTEQWPDALLMLGDQVYADDPSEAIVERLRGKHGDTGSEVDGEIRDYEEYTWLYEEAWMEPSVRWLLSTVPSGMVLDDHDLRDDWNTSQSWRRWVTQQDWWHDRVIGAYASYWVYQHLGNLSPSELDRDETFERVLAITDDDERTRFLDDFAWQTDLDASTTRFSFYRDFRAEGRDVRLVCIDSRCSRHLDPNDRRMVDSVEWAWVRDTVLHPDEPYDHLVLGSTLPFLMLPGIHHMEGWNEAVAQGAWGKRVGGRFGEWFRQFLDLEHWAAFRESFDELTELLGEVVQSENPPATVLMLSGDVHCSYTARAELDGVDADGTAIHQLTMSPFRNDIERVAKYGNKLLNRKGLSRAMHRLAKWAEVDDVDMTWQVEHGPWFDNGVMTIEFDGRSANLAIDHAHAGDTDGDTDQILDRTLDVELNDAPAPVAAAVATPED